MFHIGSLIAETETVSLCFIAEIINTRTRNLDDEILTEKMRIASITALLIYYLCVLNNGDVKCILFKGEIDN